MTAAISDWTTNRMDRTAIHIDTHVMVDMVIVVRLAFSVARRSIDHPLIVLIEGMGYHTYTIINFIISSSSPH
jgi:hypothetical protein